MFSTAAIFTAFSVVELTMTVILLYFWLTSKKHHSVLLMSAATFFAGLGGIAIIASVHTADNSLLYLGAFLLFLPIILAARSMKYLQGRLPQNRLDIAYGAALAIPYAWLAFNGYELRSALIIQTVLSFVVCSFAALELLGEDAPELKAGCRFLGITFALFAISRPLQFVGTVIFTPESVADLKVELLPMELASALAGMSMAICWGVGLSWTISSSAEYKLKLKNEELDNFTAAVAHDLKSPLNSVIGYLGLFKMSVGNPRDPKIDEYLENALDGAWRMNAFIEELLADARSEHASPELARITPETCIETAWQNLNSLADKTGGKIVVPELPPVLGNELLLIRLFQNLVGNALKYCAPNRIPLVEVSFERRNEFVEFAIQDNGIGIAGPDQEKVFREFERTVASNNVRGSGIGLSECKRIVERHGGTIWLKSEVGTGSTFYFTLKKAG
jgi:signal transduction histidine kinase